MTNEIIWYKWFRLADHIQDISSTSKQRVALGGIIHGAPCLPYAYAYPGGQIMLAIYP